MDAGKAAERAEAQSIAASKLHARAERFQRLCEREFGHTDAAAYLGDARVALQAAEEALDEACRCLIQDDEDDGPPCPGPGYHQPGECGDCDEAR